MTRQAAVPIVSGEIGLLAHRVSRTGFAAAREAVRLGSGVITNAVTYDEIPEPEREQRERRTALRLGAELPVLLDAVAGYAAPGDDAHTGLARASAAVLGGVTPGSELQRAADARLSDASASVG